MADGQVGQECGGLGQLHVKASRGCTALKPCLLHQLVQAAATALAAAMLHASLQCASALGCRVPGH